MRIVARIYSVDPPGRDGRQKVAAFIGLRGVAPYTSVYIEVEAVKFQTSHEAGLWTVINDDSPEFLLAVPKELRPDACAAIEIALYAWEKFPGDDRRRLVGVSLEVLE